MSGTALPTGLVLLLGGSTAEGVLERPQPAARLLLKRPPRVVETDHFSRGVQANGLHHIGRKSPAVGREAPGKIGFAAERDAPAEPSSAPPGTSRVPDGRRENVSYNGA